MVVVGELSLDGDVPEVGGMLPVHLAVRDGPLGGLGLVRAIATFRAIGKTNDSAWDPLGHPRAGEVLSAYADYMKQLEELRRPPPAEAEGEGGGEEGGGKEAGPSEPSEFE